MSRIYKMINRLTLGSPAPYIRMALWRIAETVVTTLPAGIMILVVHTLLMPLIDPHLSLQWNTLWICVGVLLVQSILSYILSKKSYISQAEGTADAAFAEKLRMGEVLRCLPMGYYNTHDANQVVSVLMRDFDTVEHYGGEMLSTIAGNIIRLLIFGISLSLLNPLMALALLIVVPCSVPFLWWGFKSQSRASTEQVAALQESERRSLEYVAGIKTLRGFGLAGEGFLSLTKAFMHLRMVSIKNEAASSPLAVGGRLVLAAGTGFVMLVGSGLLVAGQLDPFIFLVFLLLGLSFYEPLMSAFYLIADFSRADKAARRIEAILSEPRAAEPLDVSKPVVAGYSYRFDKVCFAYGEKEVLHEVSFTTPAKGLCALVGTSGSGKSTIAKLMARFWDPSSGEVSLGGISLKELGSEGVLSLVSVVFQDTYLFQDTIEENIRFGRLGATDEEVFEAARRAGCVEFIEQLPLGIKTMVSEGGSTLSGGQRQRLALARALLKDAPLVLLDEATASLDPENEVLIQKAYSELTKDKTVVVIAHRLASIASAEHIVVMDRGRVVEQGRHDDLMQRKGYYARLWRAQQTTQSWHLSAQASCQ